MMSDQIVLEPGFSPWRPTADSELVDVFHRFTVPLVGHIKQHGNHFLFWCVVGHAGPEGAWAYASAGPEQFAALNAATQDTFDDALRDAVQGRAASFAMATDEKGIIVAATLEPPAGFDDVYLRGMPLLTTKIREVADELRMLMDRFPMELPQVAPTNYRDQLGLASEELSARS